MRQFDIVVAADEAGGIGKAGGLPWQLPGDMAYFKRVTTETRDAAKRNAVIMGRKTWISIPERFRPLKGRLNIVLTRDTTFAANAADVMVAHDLNDALAKADREDVENVFVIGGGAVYQEALKHPACKRVYLTEVRSKFDCDTFLPSLEETFVESADSEQTERADSGIRYVFKLFDRRAMVALVLFACLFVGAGLGPPATAAGDCKRGEQLFAGNCAMCHPQGGNVLAPKKALKGPDFLKQFPKDEMIMATVRKGIPNTVMSPFSKERLSDQQVMDIIAYIRTMTPAPKPSAAVKPGGAKPATPVKQKATPASKATPRKSG